jgi:lipopolysaccharide assembly protein A
MTILTWIFRLFLFLIVLGFALTNTGVVELHFLGLDQFWRAPLVIFLLLFFVGGVVVGLLSCLPAMFRQRREIGRLKKELKLVKPAPPPPGVPLDAPLPTVASAVNLAAKSGISP